VQRPAISVAEISDLIIHGVLIPNISVKPEAG
jgi:hypothetical protein